MRRAVDDAFGDYDVVQGLDEETFIHWVFSEYLYIIYGLRNRYHDLRYRPHRDLMSRVEAQFTIPFQNVFRTYVKGPQFYRYSTEITVCLKGTDLYIWYH